MNPQKTQVDPKAFDQSRYNLGFITQMHEQLLQHKGINGQKTQQQPQTPPVASQEAPGQEKPQETTKEAPQDKNEAQMTKLELDMTKKLDDLRKELGDKHKLEIEGLRKDIELALQEDEPK